MSRSQHRIQLFTESTKHQILPLKQSFLKKLLSWLGLRKQKSQLDTDYYQFHTLFDSLLGLRCQAYWDWNLGKVFRRLVVWDHPKLNWMSQVTSHGVFSLDGHLIVVLRRRVILANFGHWLCSSQKTACVSQGRFRVPLELLYLDW